MAIVASDFPEFGTVRKTGKSKWASRSAVPTSAAISSSASLMISRCASGVVGSMSWGIVPSSVDVEVFIHRELRGIGLESWDGWIDVVLNLS